ncbi:MAG TPA: tyrosine-type recombinase/integrase [Bryobacteraceae bacterium]|nr:tyrosine-type recombinase/integrase [Bryobacteraceae bacterium]
MKNQQPKIELRKDVPRPYWRLRLFVPTPTGLRRRNFDLGFRDETTRKQANKKRLELLAKVNRGELHDSGGMAFSDLVERFRELRLPSLKASTQALYQQHLEHHLLPAFGGYELEQINRLRIEQFLASKSGLSWWTRRGILTVLSAVLGAAVEWQALDHNVATGIVLPHKAEKNPKVIPSAEQLRSLTAALDANTGMLVRLLAVTGLRVSEAIALKWSDVDWQRQTVTVRRRWYRGSMDEPKSVASVRPRWIGPLLAELRALKPEVDGFIFGGEQPIDERNELREKLRPALRSIGLPVGTGWHCFRRLHASLLQQAGASSIETSKLVGHVAIATTADYTIVGQAREAELVGGVCERLLLA